MLDAKTAEGMSPCSEKVDTGYAIFNTVLLQGRDPIGQRHFEY